MNETILKQKFKLGQVVRHNKQKVKVTAFRYEVRPMGNFHIYELQPVEGGKSFSAPENTIIE